MINRVVVVPDPVNGRARTCRAVSTNRLEGAAKIVFRDLAPQHHAGHAREVVVQPREQTRLDDLIAQIVGTSEGPDRIKIARCAGRIETTNFEHEITNAEERAEDLD